MPWKSKSQMRLFYAKRSRGEISPQTVEKWKKHTDDIKNLPDKVEKTAMINSFWKGFSKKAEENFVSANPTADIPGAPEKMLKWNPHGGVDPRTPEDLSSAEAAGLITLPPDVEGANCGTCMYFRPITPELMHGFCTNPIVKQDVTAKMLCTGWSHPGSHDPVAAAQEEQQQAQLEAAQLGMQGSPDGQEVAGGGAPAGQEAAGGGNMNPPAPAATPGQGVAGGNVAASGGPAVQSEEAKPSPVGSTQGVPPAGPTSSNPLAEQALNAFQGENASGAPTGGGGGGEAAAPAPKEPKKPKKPADSKKSTDSKKSEGKGSTINIHVGKDNVKTSELNFWRGIVDGF